MGIDKNLVQGSMALLLLRLLETKDMYGYEMIETLSERSNNVFELKVGTLYPLLHSLVQSGYLTCYEEEVNGKVRKYYQITRDGRVYHEKLVKEWRTYANAVSGMIGGECYES